MHQCCFLSKLPYLATSPHGSKKNMQHTGEKTLLGVDGKYLPSDPPGKIKGTNLSNGQFLWYKYSHFELPTRHHWAQMDKNMLMCSIFAPHPTQKVGINNARSIDANEM